MKPLKIYVGLYDRYVLCEKFPDDEDHAGLHEMLDFMYTEDEPCVYHTDENDNFTGNNVEPGFYLAHLSLENNYLNDPTDDESFLVIEKIEKFNKK